jgi:hypothetical protein
MGGTWMLRPYLGDQDRIEEFQNDDIVAIGWPLVGDLSGRSNEDFRSALEESYNLNGMALTSTLTAFDMFLNGMSVGDIVLLPHKDEVFIAKIESDYFFNDSVSDEDGYPHQRKVLWKNRLSRKELPMDLRSALKDRRVLASLATYEKILQDMADKVYVLKESKPIIEEEPAPKPAPKPWSRKIKVVDEIDEIKPPAQSPKREQYEPVVSESTEEKLSATLNKVSDLLERYNEVESAIDDFTEEYSDSVMATYPLRPDFSITLYLPNDLSKDESERLGNFISSIYFEE